MFIKKIVKTNKSTQNQYVTYRLVHSFRFQGKPRHRTILDLGTLTNFPPELHKALADRLEELISNQNPLFNKINPLVDEQANLLYNKILNKCGKDKNKVTNELLATSHGKQTTEYQNVNDTNFQDVDLNTFENKEAKTIGGEWLCKQAMDEIDFQNLFASELELNPKKNRLASMAIIGRLLNGGSDTKTADWLNENSGVSYLLGKEHIAITRKQLSQISDELYLHKDKIERYMVSRFRDLFNYRPSLLIYDLTNTHFEGRMTGSAKAVRGRNKQKRSDCPQITIAMAIDEHGFPQHSRFYEGNIGETTTLLQIIDELSKNIPDYRHSFKNTKPLVVIDAGIASKDNLVDVHNQGYDYLAVSRSQHTAIRKQIDESQLIKIQNASGQDVLLKSYKSQIKYKDKNQQEQLIPETILYVSTQEKKQKEDSMITNNRVKFEKELMGLQKSVSNPKVKNSLSEFCMKLGRLKERYKRIHFCYKTDYEHDTKTDKITKFSWEYIDKNKKEQESGSYFIRTSLTDSSDEALWHLYHKITEVESIFRTLKSDLNARPIFHQKDEHIESHLFICLMALHVIMFIRSRLKQKGITYSWKEIVRIMSTQAHGKNTVTRRDGANVNIITCTRPGVKPQSIYQAMDYREVPFYRKIVILNNL